MAVTGLQLTNAILKQRYETSIADLVNNSHYFFTRFNREVRTFTAAGRDYYTHFPIITAYNERIGARAEGGSAIPGGKTTSSWGYVAQKYIYAQLQVTNQAMEAAARDPNRFEQTLNAEKMRLVKALSVDIGRQFFGDGTGCLCLTSAADGGAASDVVPVDSPDNRYLRTGMPIVSHPDVTGSTAVADKDISEGLTEANCYTVSSKPKPKTSRTQFTLSSSDRWSDNRYIFRYGNVGNEMMGIGGIVDDYNLRATTSLRGDGAAIQTVANIDRAATIVYNANVDHNSGTNEALTLKIVDECFQLGEEDMGGKPTLVITSLPIARKFAQLMQNFEIISRKEPIKLAGGYTGLSYNGVDFVGDRYAWPNSMYFLDESSFTIYQGTNAGWIDEDGSVLYRDTTLVDVFDATYRYYGNMGCSAPGKNVCRRDISET